MGESSPSSAVPPEARPASPAKEPKCAQHLRRAVSSSDYTIRRLDKLLSSSAGQEAVLAILTYAPQVVHYALSSAPSVALLSKIQPLLRLPPPLSNPKHTQSLSTPTPTSPSTPRLLALSALASETRTTLRLFGLVGLWKWASTTLKSPPRDPVLRALTAIQIGACIAFQVLENVAYLTSRGILSKRIVDRWGGTGKWLVWSVRAWMVHVFLQFVNLARQRQLAARKDTRATTSSEKRVETETETESQQQEKQQAEGEDARARASELRAWKKSLVNNTAWAPLCVHWSLEGGIGVPSSLVGVFGFTARIWSLVDMWKATASVAG